MMYPAFAMEGDRSRLQWLVIAGCTLLALLVRLYYVNTVVIDSPIRGDAIAYFSYATNLAEHGVFSSVRPDSGQAIVPDSYRDPGYPFLVAILMRLAGSSSWYPVLLNVQAVLGAATAGLTMMLGRRWMSAGWLAAAGVLMALWPHSVTITSYVLTETLAGFLSVLWLVLLSLARKRRSRAFLSGVLAGAAGLVNAVLLPAGPVLAATLWMTGKLGRASAIMLMVGSLLLPGLWAVRGMTLEQSDAVTSSSSGRATQNLIQGTWPEYHDSYRACSYGNAAACKVQKRISDEISLLHSDPHAGLVAVTGRMRSDPWKYVAWYVTKPYLQWGWGIRMGYGDVYVYRTKISAYQANAFYRATSAIAYALNPWMFLLSALFCLRVLLKCREARAEAVSLAAFLLCVTGIYWVFQSEPRYSVPFRSMEVLTAVSMLIPICEWLRTTLFDKNAAISRAK